MGKSLHTVMGVALLLVAATMMTTTFEHTSTQVVLFRLSGVLLFVAGIYYLQRKAGFGNRHKKS